MVKIETTGKGKKALHRLNAIKDEVSKIRGIIDNIASYLTEIFEEIGAEFEPQRKEKDKPQKLRGMISGLPNRIEFPWNSLKFYIDFTLLAPEGDDPADIKGSIIYGTSRTLCFRECIFPKESEECKRCERIARCDGLEDKPIIQFTVDRHGIVKSRGELDDEWRIEDPKEGKEEEENENKKNLLDLHYRTLDHIWKDALDWTNENILP